MRMFEGINMWAVIVAAIADMVIGSFWYSPFLFGPFWQKEMGLTTFEIKGAQKSMMFAALNALVMAAVFAFLLNRFNIVSIDGGLEAAFLFWVGFVATTNSVKVIFEKTKFSVYAISVSYQLISLLVMSMILTGWK